MAHLRADLETIGAFENDAERSKLLAADRAETYHRHYLDLQLGSFGNGSLGKDLKRKG